MSRAPTAREALHLVTRFLTSLVPVGPSPAKKSWALDRLSPAEQVLFAQLSGPDQRHHIAVARRVLAARPAAGEWEVAAALLHDVGKVRSGLGTIARAIVTLLSMLLGRARLESAGRVGLYLRHPALGAEMIAAAGGDPRTAAWAREHHLPERSWTVPVEAGRVLKAADDD